MKPTLLLVGLCLLYDLATAQNYYVASVNGAVYYQNKLLKKKDKITPKGNIRFKKSDGYVKLSGPGGLYTLSADKARATGGEFLLTLSNELFPPIRPISTVSPMLTFSYDPRILSLWNFQGGYHIFFDKTVLRIDPSMTANGQIIIFLHETDQGLIYRMADIQKDSMLVIHAKDFRWNTNDTIQPNINRTLILQISQPAVLDTLLANNTTLAPILEAVAALKEGAAEALAEKITPAYQILDQLGPSTVINKRTFLKDMRFHIKKSNAKSQHEFLEVYEFNDYITETYGYYRIIYQLKQVLAEDLGLPTELN